MTIRRQPADFVVVERPGAGFVAGLREDRAGAAVHAVYELKKESLSTPEAVGMFARAIGARAGGPDYAGLKDKHAVTTQLVSVRVDGGEPVREVRGGAGCGFSARLLGWSERPVTAPEIEGNRFEIVVRDLSKQQSTEMEMRAGRLAVEGGLLVMNYFGAQRFGSARHGKGFVAPHLIRGDFEGALKLAIGTPARKDTGKTRQFTRLCAGHWGDWKMLAAENGGLPRCPERRAIEVLATGGSFAKAFEALPHFTQQMCVEAYQSHLWNAASRRLAERMAEEYTVRWQAEGGDEAARKTQFRPVAPLRGDDEFGVMLFPTAVMVDAEGDWLGVAMPVLGPMTVLDEPWGSAAAAALAEEGVKQEDLRIPGMRRPFFGEAERPLFVVAEGFEMSEREADELSGGKRFKRTVRFSLGRGAYATVVLRALGQ